jgi:ribosomal protein S18 acetylase RimI-like enzyme
MMTDEAMRLRRLGEPDAEPACDIVAGFKGSSVDAGYMAEFLADERNCLIGAFADDRLVGFVLAYELPRVDGPRPMMLLYEIEVAADYRRRGIGSALIGELKRICRQRGAAKMFVATGKSNVAAMALYASTGGQRPSTGEAMFEYRFE